MYNTLEEVIASSAKGYVCAQTVMKAGLALSGRQNEGLLKALNALGGGCYTRKSTCGALIGACCAIGYYTGRAQDDETQHDLLIPMTREFVNWFESVYGVKYGGLECAAIRKPAEDGLEERPCNAIIFACCQKVVKIIKAHGFG